MIARLLQRLRGGRHREPTLPLPPRLDNHAGQPRRVGVELEFSGLGIERIGNLMRASLGGVIEPVSPYEYRIADTALGDFRVELDYAYLKKLGRRERGGDALANLEQLSEDMLAALAKRVVPYEIISPPIALQRLHELEPLIERLRVAGARGTGESPIYAFGLHLNPELPALDAATVRDYLRAYCVLFDWLCKRSAVDVSRRVFPYIQPYPKDYVRLLIDADYAPDQAGLIDDYLAHNPTRNRALDMLPLFAHLDADRVRAAVADDRVNARPTLHYRLPNCDIEHPGWGIGSAWAHWLQVEHLAADPTRLEAACTAYRVHLAAPLSGLLGGWAEQAEAWTCPDDAL